METHGDQALLPVAAAAAQAVDTAVIHALALWRDGVESVPRMNFWGNCGIPIDSKFYGFSSSALSALPGLPMTFVGPGFTRKPPKYERFIRPTGELPFTYTADRGAMLQTLNPALLWPEPTFCLAFLWNTCAASPPCITFLHHPSYHGEHWRPVCMSPLRLSELKGFKTASNSVTRST
eukprot:scaffold28621_cov20-Tisochrysis_lutea.AAC.1